MTISNALSTKSPPVLWYQFYVGSPLCCWRLILRKTQEILGAVCTDLRDGAGPSHSWRPSHSHPGFLSIRVAGTDELVLTVRSSADEYCFCCLFFLGGLEIILSSYQLSFWLRICLVCWALIKTWEDGSQACARTAGSRWTNPSL